MRLEGISATELIQQSNARRKSTAAPIPSKRSRWNSLRFSERRAWQPPKWWSARSSPGESAGHDGREPISADTIDTMQRRLEAYVFPHIGETDVGHLTAPTCSPCSVASSCVGHLS